MLKDITLGQYFPGNTPAHRLDPRTKILLVVLYIVALFCAKSVLTYGLVALTLFICVRISKVGLKALVEQAGATVVGAGIAIEKVFQGGGDLLRQQGLRIESLARIAAMSDDSLTFC